LKLNFFCTQVRLELLRGDGLWLFERDGGGVARGRETAARVALAADRSRAAAEGERANVTGGAGPPGGVLDGRRLKDKERTPGIMRTERASIYL
jgi:hypothetical protein